MRVPPVFILALIGSLSTARANSYWVHHLRPKECAAARAWVAAPFPAGSAERIVRFDWDTPDDKDVIPMWAFMSSGDRKLDAYDHAFYDAVAPRTHGLYLNEFGSMIAECFDSAIPADRKSPKPISVEIDAGSRRLGLDWKPQFCSPPIRNDAVGCLALTVKPKP